MARKLFPSYGSALANHMLTALDRQQVVHAFVTAYVSEYGRRGILGGPTRDRELAETIGREAILAMVNATLRKIPGFYGKQQRAALRQEEKEAVDAFSHELLSALKRAWDLDRQDRQQFRRDLLLYSECAERQAKAERARQGRKVPARAQTKVQARVQVGVQAEESPFVARVALLLDPSMLEQARRAARKFHGEIERLARKLLSQTLRPD